MKKAVSVFLIFNLLNFFSFQSFSETAPLSEKDRTFLEMIQRDAFKYFEEYSDPETGLIHDSSSKNSPASIAATGFALASFAIAQKHGWIGYRDAYETVDKIFKILETKAANQNGFYYHFLDASTGRRAWSSEASSIDTALLMAGVLLAGQYFTNLRQRAARLYESVDWPWMLNGTELMSHGWKPNSGFIPYYWDIYSEHLLLLALAIGSPSYPASPAIWQKWKRETDEYNGRKIIYSFSGSLFTYQYPQAFIDFRNLDDNGINYFENSKQATLANREFCIANQNEFPAYSENFWGLSASLGPDGYKAYGALPGNALYDGTVAPYAVAGSIVFTPEESIASLRYLYEKYGDKIYGPFGFKDALNPDRNWWSAEYLGIDQGIIVVMLENYLYEGDVWKRFMALPAIQTWIKKTNLKTDLARENVGERNPS